MKTNINLLPQDIAARSEAFRLAAWIKKASLALGIVFVLAGTAAGSYLLILRSQVSGSRSRVEALKVRIAELEPVEQRYTLVKDRLSKINEVVGEDNVDKGVSNVTTTYNSLPDGSQLTQININATQLEMTATTPSSANLVQIFGQISQLKDYSSIFLSTLSYRPGTGFSAQMELK